ncbi:type II toxin-antitoxin system mRNA interferase toxin, RelE/StbE family [Candidatus Trichorickettsia mobilis]|uniref:type II toxin-antitoxin system mRNA interferase toxin, RelE/StbE family n=1 Tax=Candidatus Trichorickettsia mobilis TaxID=1346319 RepID=UPI00292F44BF|nr:type II toxin-antitoxin system mRNA interferase toxin, RelE/StbE family [Candidatus Trichorickettsia mobilis]
MLYTLIYSKEAVCDSYKLKTVKLATKVEKLCKDLAHNPKPIYIKKLSGDLFGKRSIRINLQHRLIYEILEEQKIVKILKMWGSL